MDILKIDGQFVREMLKNPIDEAMVKAINEIGKVMDKTMVAEFAETDLILKRLKDMGIDCAQGHAIAPPPTADRYDPKRLCLKSATMPLPCWTFR